MSLSISTLLIDKKPSVNFQSLFFVKGIKYVMNLLELIET